MYSAESVIQALNSNKELSCEGIDVVGCPTSHEGCTGTPEKCELCINQNCSQPVSIHKKFQRLAILNFRFMISHQNHGGFIRKDDSALKQLIRNNHISKAMLKEPG
jgi:hypothetical protein